MLVQSPMYIGRQPHEDKKRRIIVCQQSATPKDRSVN